MAVEAATFLSYTAVGNREDLSDDIFRIDPTDTPFFSMCEKETATNTKHEWQTQALSSPDGNNANLEGDDATSDSVTPTVRLDNLCQISDKVARVSGTQQAIEHAGRDSELAYQETLKGLELKRDIETILTQNQPKTATPHTIATVRKTASILAWLKSNVNMGGGAAANPVGDGSNARTDGTQRAFTEAQLKAVLASCWTNGGKPDTIMVGGFNKQAFSMFVGRASPTEDTSGKKIIATVDYYQSDFGLLKVVANRFSRARDCLVLQSDMWAVAHLDGRKMLSIALAKTGDSDRRQMLSEYCLVSRNEKASGLVADLTTA